MDDFPDYEGSTTHSDSEATPPVEIPAETLSTEALNGVIENYVLREGTDYGSQEVGYDAKADRVRKQIERGDIKIIFDPDSETVTLMTAREWEKVSRG